MEPHPPFQMTIRQVQIYNLLSEGRTIKQITVQLKISRRCVLRNMRKVRDGLDANTRDQVMVILVRRGMI